MFCQEKDKRTKGQTQRKYDDGELLKTRYRSLPKHQLSLQMASTTLSSNRNGCAGETTPDVYGHSLTQVLIDIFHQFPTHALDAGVLARNTTEVRGDLITSPGHSDPDVNNGLETGASTSSDSEFLSYTIAQT